MRVMAIGTLGVDLLAVELPEIAAPGAVVYASIETRIGGHPVDVAIDLVKLGARPDNVAIVAALGKGIYADHVQSVIDGYGLTTFLQAVDDRDVGRNVVLEVAGEDRRFHLDPGANWLLDPAGVAAAIAEWRPEVVTVRPGYTGIDLDLEAALAPVDGALVFLDLMQPHPSRPPGYLDPALRRADVVHCNEFEAKLVTGAATAEEAVAAFLSHGVDLVLITAGERGATANTHTHRIWQPAFEVDVADVTGSGDAFCAGFIHALGDSGEYLEQAELPRLLRSGQAAGAAAATAVGCVEGVTAELVERLVAEQGELLLRRTEIVERE
jgi:sugar/nucleoside kinase (ribokinase family)